VVVFHEESEAYWWSGGPVYRGGGKK